jgi:hypothetical protein
MKFAKATKFNRKSGQGLGINPEDDLPAPACRGSCRRRGTKPGPTRIPIIRSVADLQYHLRAQLNLAAGL